MSYTELLRNLVCGQWEDHQIPLNSLNFNSPNQTDRYDPVPLANRVTLKASHTTTCEHVRQIRRAFGYNFDDGDEGNCTLVLDRWWATQASENLQFPHALWERVAGERDASGCIYITGGRGKWFGEKVALMPIVMWCLANGRHVDVVVDVKEAAYYRQQVLGTSNLQYLFGALNDYLVARDRPPLARVGEILDLLSIVAPDEKRYMFTATLRTGSAVCEVM